MSKRRENRKWKRAEEEVEELDMKVQAEKEGGPNKKEGGIKDRRTEAGDRKQRSFHPSILHVTSPPVCL